jgi:nitrogen-specific signal transduction histidine kinase
LFVDTKLAARLLEGRGRPFTPFLTPRLTGTGLSVGITRRLVETHRGAIATS